MRDGPEAALARLGLDPFRRKFRLGTKERAHVERWGLAAVEKQGRDILRARIAPAEPRNDGRQTPWRNHPVFIAQHATATCCRKCLETWHGVARGQELSEADLSELSALLLAWISTDMRRSG